MTEQAGEDGILSVAVEVALDPNSETNIKLVSGIIEATHRKCYLRKDRCMIEAD